MSFRKATKERLVGKVPTKVCDMVREAAFRERITMSEVMTRALCREFKIDATQYGVRPKSRSRVAVQETVASAN